MNLQLSSLRLSALLSSPVLSFSPMSTKSHLFTQNSQVIRSSWSFISFEGLAHSHIHKKGRFEQFLIAPITYNNIEIKNLTIYTVGFNFELESDITIKDCIFLSCSSTQQGGAISYGHRTGQYSVFNLDTCYFIDCSSTHGGALFASSNRSVLIRNCYTRCHATLSCHAIYIRSVDSRASDFCYVNLNNCPDTASEINHAILLTQATFNFRYNNITSNNKGGYGMGIAVHRANALYIRYSQFSNLTGTSIVHMRQANTLYSTFSMISNNKLSESIFTLSENTEKVYLYLNRATIVSNMRTGKSIVYDVDNPLVVSFRVCHLDDGSRDLIGSTFNLSQFSPLDIESELDNLPPIPAPSDCMIEATVVAPQQTDSATLLILIICASALAVISIGVVFLYRYNKNKKDEYENWISNRSYASGSAI